MRSREGREGETRIHQEIPKYVLAKNYCEPTNIIMVWQHFFIEADEVKYYYL